MAIKYINAAATGTGTGDSWANAYETFADVTWTRGNTYYVAGGFYDETTVFCTVSESSSQLITIKKANESDNGLDAGWNPDYATDQAVFDGRLVTQYGNIVIDGVTGSHNSGHGIKFICSEGTSPPLSLSAASGTENIQLLHLEICRGSSFTATGVDALFDATGTTNKKKIRVAYCYIHTTSRNATNLTALVGTSYSDYGLLFENNYVAMTGGALNLDHGQGLQIQTDSAYLIYRNNIFRDCSGTAFIAFLGVDKVYENVRIYNNVFYKDDIANYPTCSPGVLYGRDTVTTNDFEVYNNTVYAIGTSTASRGDFALYGTCSGNLLKNNLWEGNYFSTGKNSGFDTIDTNGFYGNTNSVPSGTAGQVNGSGTTFTDAESADFSLVEGGYAVGVGLDLSSVFTTDITGATRTTWDLGAYAANSDGNPDPGDETVLTAGNSPVTRRLMFC